MPRLSTRLSDATDDRDNNFNLLRFGAAAAVILSHSFILTGNEPNSLPQILGFFAVNCFFIISGFLVCKSLIQRPRILDFLKARVLRIYPALFLAVLFCVFIVGPGFTTIALSDYFSNSTVYIFLIKNNTLLLGNVEYYLPGVFEQNTTDRKVNAPLWTIFYEIYRYITLGVLGLIFRPHSKTRMRIFKWLVLVSSITLLILFVLDVGYKIIPSQTLGRLTRFGAMFGLGASYYLFRDRITLSPILLVIAIVAIGVSVKDRLLFNGICYLFLGYILLYFAYIPKGLLLEFNKLGDYSYGLYIFAYPIQQIVLQWWPDLATQTHFLVSFLLALVVAIFSWHLVESKALKLKPVSQSARSFSQSA